MGTKTKTTTECIVTDLGEAAALKASGFELLRLEETARAGQRSFVFSFDFERRPDWLDEAITDPSEALLRYRKRGELMVDAQDMYDAMRSLKNKLHASLEFAG